jgi:L-fuculose-phosphate aldolase
MDRAARAALADYARRVHARGWVANHEGNLTIRLGPGRILATPTATSKAEVTPEGLIVVDEAGRIVAGQGKPFSELSLHLCVYAERPDARAVIHAHPPTATGFALAGVALDRPLMAEAVVSLGPSIPTVPFAPPGPAAAAALAPHLRGTDVCLLAGHGVLAWGEKVEQAYLRLEHVEHLARIVLVARQLGGPQELPKAALPALLEARQKASPTMPAATATATAASAVIATPDPDLTRIITEEVTRLLSGQGS